MSKHVRGESHPQFRHGMARSAENNCWRSIKQRCTDPNVRSYPRYGGRGIKMCDRWNESFLNFLADVGLRPSPNHSIDRPRPNPLAEIKTAPVSEGC